MRVIPSLAPTLSLFIGLLLGLGAPSFSADQPTAEAPAAGADERLPAETPIFAFQWRGEPHAVPHSAFADGGAVLELDGRRIFLYRQPDDPSDRGTAAFLVAEFSGVEKTPTGWFFNSRNGRTIPFDPQARTFGVPESSMAPLPGEDMAWSTWSAEHPDTAIIGDSTAEAEAGEDR